MAKNDRSNETAPSFKTRVVRVLILTGVTVVFGYGGWIVLTLTASVVGYDPKTEDGDSSEIDCWIGPTETEM